MADSFHVGGGSNDPKYRVEGLGKDRESRESPPEREPSPPSPSFMATMALVLKKFLDLFDHTTERGLFLPAEISCREHLLLLKKSFEVLQKEDRSRDPSFINHLSDLWSELLSDLMRFRRSTPVAEKLRSFIRELQHYPEGAQYTLGYYLSEYAGQKWLPFPYMEMIYRLQIQHTRHPNESALSKWAQELETMAKMLED